MGEWFLTKTRFDIEAKDNVEIVHYYVVVAKDGIQTENLYAFPAILYKKESQCG